MIYTVMKSGGEYNVGHVFRLRMQLMDFPVKTLSDVPFPGAIPLKYDYPGWWSKLEIMNPATLDGDVFYMDLDTAVIGDIRPMLHPGRTTFLSDFYRPEQIQSSMFYITAADRAKVWDAWITEEPRNVMSRFGKLRAGFNGDQNFIEEVLGRGVARWQNEYPGMIQSYKAAPAFKDKPHPCTRVVIFHGRPRPWDVGM